ncbi:hypothetical protein NYR55_09300 [Sphingomonas sp. BGYR3]|uniref:hypothetical protein n=1 Tax=Sphingomonas sp. BGYR3 TaxID=2975483 RepID=UPI0021A379AD|nr:hypothetical protein [Sphingomonas sp. BGYR3]MDG5488812.1 hypothetical protein [Sphingomonas sp. BGYR3]
MSARLFVALLGSSICTSTAWASPQVSDAEALKAAIAEQQRQIEAQQRIIEQQRIAIDDLQGLLLGADIVTYRGRGVQGLNPSSSDVAQKSPQAGAPRPEAAPPAAQQTAEPAMPDAPVGDQPEVERDVRNEVAAVPQDVGVLTPAGRIVIDPTFEYTQSATDRLVFRGFELVPGIQIGLIEASRARRETIASTMAVRYGLTNRLEIEARIPGLHRYDRIEVAQQRDEGIVRSISLKEDDIGDIEFAARYQLNSQRGQNPIWVASLRVKSDTGKGPFDIAYDEFGVATGLATGSGFWGVQPGLSMLLPSDPVVIFAGATYLWHIGRDVDRLIGSAPIGHVDPGDAISGNLGFGFALNPRFSFALGYRHSYLMATKTEIGDGIERSRPLQVGSMTLGMSYRLNVRQTISFGVEFGVTEDAPDVSVTLRFPFVL